MKAGVTKPFRDVEIIPAKNDDAMAVAQVYSDSWPTSVEHIATVDVRQDLLKMRGVAFWKAEIRRPSRHQGQFYSRQTWRPNRWFCWLNERTWRSLGISLAFCPTRNARPGGRSSASRGDDRGLYPRSAYPATAVGCSRESQGGTLLR